jgi:hypothetical protein
MPLGVAREAGQLCKAAGADLDAGQRSRLGLLRPIQPGIARAPGFKPQWLFLLTQFIWLCDVACFWRGRIRAHADVAGGAEACGAATCSRGYSQGGNELGLSWSVVQ